MAVEKQIQEINEKIDRLSVSLSREIKDLTKAIMGDLDNPGGLQTQVRDNARDIEAIRKDVEKNSAEINELVKWRTGITSKAVGIGIGISLGSGSVAYILAQIFAP